MALITHETPTPRELIETARTYPVHSPARLAYMAESAAVSLAYLAEHATSAADEPLTTPGIPEPEPDAALPTEVLPDSSGAESDSDASEAPPQPKRARKTRAVKSPAPTESNAA